MMRRNLLGLLGVILMGLCLLSFQNCSQSFSTPAGTTSTASNDPTSASDGNGDGNNVSCNFNGLAVDSGASIVAFQTSHVASGSTCSMQVRTCNDGTLNGSYDYASCTVDVAASASCSFNGQTLASGTSVTAYFSSSVPAGQTCTSQTRTCTNGTLSGTYSNASCSVSTSFACNMGAAAVGGKYVWFNQTSCTPRNHPELLSQQPDLASCANWCAAKGDGYCDFIANASSSTVCVNPNNCVFWPTPYTLGGTLRSFATPVLTVSAGACGNAPPVSSLPAF